MIGRSILGTACAAAVSLGAFSALAAQSDSPRSVAAPVSAAAKPGSSAAPAGDAIAPEVATNPWRRPPPTDAKAPGDIAIWKTITLGSYRDVNALREDLDSLHCGLEGSAAGIHARAAFVPGTAIPLPCSLGESAAEIIGRPAFSLSKAATRADLVVVSVTELGFTGEGAAVADIYARARQLGLELCSAEVGPQLRLQYLDQPVGEFLRIAMEPIATYGGDLIDLTVANGGASLLLIGGDAHADAVVDPSVRFVFARSTRIAQPIVP